MRVTDLGAFDITSVLPEETVQQIQAAAPQVEQLAQQAQQLVGTPKAAFQPIAPGAPAPPVKVSMVKRYGPIVAIAAGVLATFWAVKRYIL